MAIDESRPYCMRNSDRWPALLGAGQAGDAVAYGQFLSEACGFLRNIVLRAGIEQSSADDVVQETLITVHAVRHTYDPKRPIKPWLTAIARRRAVDWRRKFASANAHEVALDPDVLAAAPESQANAAFARIDARRMVAHALEELSPVQRRAIELMKLREMTLKEATRVTGQSAGALKVAVHRAVRSMRDRLAAA